MAEYGYGFLHTNSAYTEDFNGVETLNRASFNSAEKKAQLLEQQEARFYALFGASSLESFIQKVRELFDKEDREVYLRFSNEKIMLPYLLFFRTT